MNQTKRGLRLVAAGALTVLGCGLEPDEIDFASMGDSGDESSQGDTATGDGDGDPTDVPCSDLPSDELGLDDNAVSLDDVASTFDGSCGGDGPDALYRFTAPSDGTYTFTLNSGEFDGVLYLVGPSCAPLEEIDCALADVELSLAMSANEVVYVLVDSTAGFGAGTVAIGMM